MQSTTHTPTATIAIRERVQHALRTAWIKGRTWVQPRLIDTVKRIERSLGVVPQRAWFDRVDRASDDSFPASDPPSYSSPTVGATSHDKRI